LTKVTTEKEELQKDYMIALQKKHEVEKKAEKKIREKDEVDKQS
jgi:hypothetical protein